MSHILNMTLAASIGLIAVFSVDFIDLFFLSQLEDKAIQAALGFTGTILFATISIGIGLSIAAAATLARAVGEQDPKKAQRRTTNNLIYTAVISSLIALILFLIMPSILSLLGAKDHVLELSLNYLIILVPTMPIFAISIVSSAMLRALGDAKRAALVTIGGGLVNAILDPIFIFTLDMGFNGAAIATLIARFSMMGLGLYGLYHYNDKLFQLRSSQVKKDFKPYITIAIPAVLTNIATPIGNGYVTYAVASYGNAAVAAWAIIARILPLSFCAVFALSGAIGPIIGQNLGGKKYERVKQTLTDAIKFNTLYTLFIWLALVIAAPFIISLLQLKGLTADLVNFFCFWLSPLFGMIGYLFIANATFNNMDKPKISMWLNWARATLGTVPFVYVGGYIAGSYGLLTGQILGGALTAIYAIYLCYKTVKTIDPNQNH